MVIPLKLTIEKRQYGQLKDRNNLLLIKGRVKMEKKHGFWECIYVIYVFLSVFNPDFFSIEMSTILRYLGLAYIGWNVLSKHRLQVKRKNIYYFSVFIPFFLYILLNAFLQSAIYPSYSQEIIANAKTTFNVFINAFICFGVTSIIVEKKRLCSDDIIVYLIYAASLQTLCVVLAFLFPTIRDYFNAFTIKNSPSQHLINYVLMNEQRCYGLADNLFDSFGYTTSMLIIPTFIYGISKNKKWLILFMVMLVMPILNARTGLLLVAVAVVVVIICFVRKIFLQDILKYVLIIPVSTLLFMQLYNILPQSTQQWIEKGINAITLFIFANESTSTFAALSNMTGIPSNWILGYGASPEALLLGNTDIGYVQLIWRFGIIGTVLLLGAYILAFVSLFKKANTKTIKCYIVCVLVIFLVYLIKLYSIGNNCGNFIIYTLMAVVLSENIYLKEE